RRWAAFNVTQSRTTPSRKTATRPMLSAVKTHSTMKLARPTGPLSAAKIVARQVRPDTGAARTRTTTPGAREGPVNWARGSELMTATLGARHTARPGRHPAFWQWG